MSAFIRVWYVSFCSEKQLNIHGKRIRAFYCWLISSRSLIIILCFFTCTVTGIIHCERVPMHFIICTITLIFHFITVKSQEMRLNKSQCPVIDRVIGVDHVERKLKPHERQRVKFGHPLAQYYGNILANCLSAFRLPWTHFLQIGLSARSDLVVVALKQCLICTEKFAFHAKRATELNGNFIFHEYTKRI